MLAGGRSSRPALHLDLRDPEQSDTDQDDEGKGMERPPHAPPPGDGERAEPERKAKRPDKERPEEGERPAVRAVRVGLLVDAARDEERCEKAERRREPC